MRLSNISVKVLIILSTNTGCPLDGMYLCLCFREMCMKELVVLVSSLSICYDNCWGWGVGGWGGGGPPIVSNALNDLRARALLFFVLFRDDCKHT